MFLLFCDDLLFLQRLGDQLCSIGRRHVECLCLSGNIFCEGCVYLCRRTSQTDQVLIDAQIKWFRTQSYYDDISWHGTWKMDGGGALMNQGIHAIDLLRWFGGDVADISSRTATLAHERIEVEDTAGAVISFKSGAIGIIEGSTAAYPGFLKRIEICGSEGSAIIEEESLKFWQFKNERPEDAEIRAEYADFTSTGGGAGDPKAIGFHGHASEFADIIDALNTGRDPEITGREARKAVEVIEAVYRSSREGKTVKL